MLGHWQNYEQLEENLSMPELIKTLEAMQKVDERNKKFQASLQGIDLNEEQKEGSTFEDVKRRALGIDASGNDVISLQGQFAQEAGFGVGAGLGYSKE